MHAAAGTGHVRVVNDHVIEGEAGALVLFCDLAKGVEEQTVAKFHDVGLVHTRHFLGVA